MNMMNHGRDDDLVGHNVDKDFSSLRIDNFGHMLGDMNPLDSPEMLFDAFSSEPLHFSGEGEVFPLSNLSSFPYTQESPPLILSALNTNVNIPSTIAPGLAMSPTGSTSSALPLQTNAHGMTPPSHKGRGGRHSSQDVVRMTQGLALNTTLNAVESPAEDGDCDASKDDSDEDANAPSSTSSTFKRKRVKAACNTCNRRKVKCDGGRPCSNCVKAAVECNFDRKTETARIPKALQIQNLENRVKSLESMLTPMLSSLTSVLNHVPESSAGAHGLVNAVTGVCWFFK